MKNGTQWNTGIGHAHIYTLYTYQNENKLLQPTANTTSAIQPYSIVRDYSASPWLAFRIWLCCVSHITDTCICIMYIHIYVSTPANPAFGMNSDQVIVSLVGFHICMYYSCSCYIQFHQELIRPRNSHVTVAQVPTWCSKFTAINLANYSKTVSVLYQLWCKIYFWD